MNEAQAAQMVARCHARVIARPRDFLERVEAAARKLVRARRRCDELEARRELVGLLGNNFRG